MRLSQNQGNNEPRDPGRMSTHPERLNLHSSKGLLSKDSPDKNKEIKSLKCLGTIFESSLPTIPFAEIFIFCEAIIAGSTK